MQSNTSRFGLRGFLIDTPEFGALRGRPNGAVLVENGRISNVGDNDEIRRLHPPNSIQWINRGAVAIFPGLIDCHTHLPQYSVVARGESELLPWLRQHIFLVEREFTGPKARDESPQFFHELARNGTTTVMAYAAIYEDSCDIGFEAARQSGVRTILGKMMMDLGSYGQIQPKKILSISLVESERLCRKWHKAENGLLEYAFSPRFAVTCSEKLMLGAAQLAARYGAYLQTHLAENREELEKVHHLHMTARDYTHVYEKCGLLTPRTVLGHCIHVNPREIAAIAAAQSSVAHCPSSNLFLGSGLMRLDQLLKAGINVGLGSDVAGGPELSMWRVMRAAIEVQKARTAYEPSLRPLRPSEALYLATQGGARALGKSASIGTLHAGKEADLIVVDITSLLPYPQHRGAMAGLTPEDVVALCIYRGGPDANLETYVRGKCIYQAPNLPNVV
ncbi:MAG TPA: guanine deaminase [Chthoniobacterales bacterium]|nr:guanine deaminase [Chthoniobacterales bacterium]